MTTLRSGLWPPLLLVACVACTDPAADTGDAAGPTGGGVTDGAATGAATGASTSSSGAGGQDPDAGGPRADAGPMGHGTFEERCAAPGVLRCVGFDSEAEIQGEPGNPTGIMSGSDGKPTIDPTTSASGEGSLLFVIPVNAGSDPAGSYFANFSDDFGTQFDGGGEFFVQWRQRFSPEYIDTLWGGGETAWKQAILGTGDKPGCTPSNTLNLESYPGQGYCAYSCTSLELVTTRNYENELPIMYNSCSGSSSHGPYDGFYEPFGADDFKLENAMPDPFCTYHEQADGTHGNCFYYQPDEWMTFQVHVLLGPRQGDEFVGSVVELYGAREGQSSIRVIAWGDVAGGHPAYNLSAGDPALDETYGKVWLLPYMTNKSSSQPNPEARTWYDELIVSKNPIADP